MARGVSLGWIGLYSLVGPPHMLKFPGAPVVDAFRPPWLSGSLDPLAVSWRVAARALPVTLARAIQDSVIDAFPCGKSRR
ncbi:MAG: hypothetical protein V6Z86_02245 [Hyphomicrobiales bacterium]